MFKKIKGFILAVLMAAIFPVLRIPGNDPSAAAPPTNPPASPPDPAVRISELEQLLVGKESELNQAKEKITSLEQSATQTASRLTQLDDSLKKAVTGYKTLVLAANPEVLPDLIAGETVADIDASLIKAKDLVEKVKTNLLDKTRQNRIPPGAPQRGSGDTTSLSSREKIQQGISKTK